MPYLAAAYVVFWAVTFGFVFTMSARLQRLEEELRTLRTALDSRNQSE